MLPSFLTRVKRDWFQRTTMPGADVPVLRPNMPVQERRRAELLWDYGDSYWSLPAHAARLRPAKKRARA